MRSRYKAVVTEYTYFITSTIVNWISLFSDEKYIKILIDAIKYNQVDKDLKIFAYVIMPNHFHALVQCEELLTALQSIKSYSAKKFIEELNKDRNLNILKQFKLFKLPHKIESDYQIWQEGYHPQIIENSEMFSQKVDYIHNNPVRKGLVDSPEKWKYSSYPYYYLNKQCDIEIFSYD